MVSLLKRDTVEIGNQTTDITDWERLRGEIGNELEPYIECLSLPPYLLKHETDEMGNQLTDTLQTEI